MLESRIHANNLRIRFAVDQARKSVECGTTHAGARVQGLTVLFIEQNAERQRKGMMAEPLQIVVKLLNARFVAYWRMAVGGARRTFRGIDPVFSMNVIQVLRFRVIRLEVLIAERPGGRDAAIVADFPKILLAKPQQRRAINLRISADVILNAWVKLVSILVVPGFFGSVFRFEKDGAGFPVVFLPRQVAAPFQK